jgi:hypothetical protein
MKSFQHTKRAAALGLSALILSSVMLCSVACTRDDMNNPGTPSTSDSTPGGSTAVTTPAQNGGNNGSGSSSDKPMDPNAGTVNPDSDAGNPPAGSDSRDTRSYRDDSFRSRFMH